MFFDSKILIGKTSDTNEKVFLYPKMANRHGLIAGATGTGKTITLKVLAESFSACGVPVFLADAKGDLSGMGLAGETSQALQERIEKMGLNDLSFSFSGFPSSFWDIYQEKGIPLRSTISEMGPMILSKVLGLNDIQEDILTIIFKIADDEKLLLIDTKDLKSMLQYVEEHAKEYSLQYGNITSQSVAAIIRAIVALESEGGQDFFAEPALNINDWIRCDQDGRGMINILDCQKLMMNTNMYSAFLLWLMSELFETLPEVGDMEKPKMVFFFDEAHTLFRDAPKELLMKIEQVVKLIRSKGVGIYFITQSPSDIPDQVLAQLGNKIQHAIHAYTPAETKKVKAAAESFRPNPNFVTSDVIMELAVGEALVSTLGEDGVPSIVERCKILPPQSKMGMISEEERKTQINGDILYSKYFQSVDNPSAYEFLNRQGIDPSLNQENANDNQVIDNQEISNQTAYNQAESNQTTYNQAASNNTINKQESNKPLNRTEEFIRQRQKEKQEASTFQKEMKKVGRSVAGSVGREAAKSLVGGSGNSIGKRIAGNAGASFARGIFNTFLK